MRKRNLYNIFVSLFVFCISVSAYSQTNFKYTAAIDSITTTGFYKVDLPPELIAKCKNTLEDIRILDEEGSQVSYIIKNDLPVFKKEYLTEFPVLKYEKEKDKLTHIILKNITAKAVSELLLFIKNMDAYRSFSLSGSDDSLHWFIIKENIQLENAFNNDGENIIKTFSFPGSNYTYLQLTISGENVLPFNITKAGIYNEDIFYGKYSEIPKPLINQIDSSDKNSYITLKFNDTYQVNKIIITADGPKYFKRKITISTGSIINTNVIYEGYISSDSVNSFPLTSKASQLYIIVNNEDNNPLKVKTADAFQLNVSLLTYLQAEKKYSLYFGDTDTQAPKYDLGFFSESAGKNPLETGIQKIKENKKAVSQTKSFGFTFNKITLWLIIIAVLFILCFFTFKMIKEVNKR